MMNRRRQTDIVLIKVEFLFYCWHILFVYSRILAFDLQIIFSATLSPVNDWSNSTRRHLTYVWHVNVVPAHFTWMELHVWSIHFNPKRTNSVFPRWRDNLLLIDQVVAASISKERLSWTSWVFLHETKRAESSAYKNVCSERPWKYH